MFGKYIKSYFQSRKEYWLAGRKNYEEEKTKSYSLRRVKILNPNFAKELEEACKKNNGPLSMAQYFSLDQFGKYGYHNTHSFNGNTTSFETWGKALAMLCKNEGYGQIIDIGAGDGRLGREVIKHVKDLGIFAVWHGVDVNPHMLPVIQQTFKKEGLEKYLGTLATDISKIHLTKKALVIFSFSLDSISPQAFVNTTIHKNYPNSLLGLQVSKNMITEVVLSQKELQKKKMSLKNGIYTKDGFSYNLRSWKLHPWQRAFVPIDAFSFLKKIISYIPKNSKIVIIDEFPSPTKLWDTEHLCVPRDLATVTRDVYDFDKLYAHAGTYILYYTTYLSTYLALLRALGIENLQWGLDAAFARFISEGKRVVLKHEAIWRSYGVTGVKKGTLKKSALLPGPFDEAPEKYHF